MAVISDELSDNVVKLGIEVEEKETMFSLELVVGVFADELAVEIDVCPDGLVAVVTA